MFRASRGHCPGNRIIVGSGAYRAKPARVFAFEEIADAHRVMEANQVGGKLVIAGA